MTEFESAPSAHEAVHFFVDEAGDPTLFDSRGRIIVGSPGCSNYFILGKLEVEDSAALSSALEQLRTDLLKDPYFSGIPSMQPAERKTARVFHAKDDLPEVRREVFRLLLAQKIRFSAVVRNKRDAVAHEARLREKEPSYRYKPNDMYDGLVQRLFSTPWNRSKLFNICFAKRGKSDRTAALQTALCQAILQYDENFRTTIGAHIQVTHASPEGIGALQAVDYCLWAVQRFYEFEQTEKCDSECRFVDLISSLTVQIDDVDFVRDGKMGVCWNRQTPLSLAARGAGNAHKKVGDIGPDRKPPDLTA